MDPTQQPGYVATAQAPGEQMLRWLQWLMEHGGNAVQAGMQPLNTTPTDPGAQYALSRMSQPTPLEGLAQAPAQPLANEIKNTQSAEAAARTPAEGPPPPGAPPADGGNTDPPEDKPQAGAPSSSVTAGPNAPAAPGAGDPSTAAPAQPAAAPGAAAPATNAGAPIDFSGARNENVYGMRDSDNMQDYGRRLLQQGTTDSGSNLFSNPSLASSPWARWLDSRYSGQLANQVLGAQAGGQIPTGGLATYAQSAVRNLAGGGGSPAGGSPFENLKTISDSLGRYTGGDTSGMNPDQVTMLQRLSQDPGAQASLFVNAARGSGGGWGAQGAQSIAQNMLDQYSNDQQSALQRGPFLGAALKMIGQ